MSPNRISASDIGTTEYQTLLKQEADFWERSARGEMDNSVATWRSVELADATSGDLLRQALDLAVEHGPRVLELACADGALGMRLARRGCVTDGVDISFGLIQQGREQIEQLRPAENWPGNVRLFVADLNRLALAPNTYDVVFAAAALHHVIDLNYLTNELYQTLKPGGVLICLDHMESSLLGKLLRYAFLFILPTEVSYWRKPIHLFNRVMARVLRRLRPQRTTPARFTLPDRSPFEDISGAEAIDYVRRRFAIDSYQTYLAFADVVAGHLRLGSETREVKMARRLRRLDDWLIKHLGVRGETYFLVARKPKA